MSVRRTIAGTLVVPMLLSALVACGGGDDSVADPPISSPPKSSPTQAPQRETPEHFIRRFYESEREMENSGNTSEYRSLTRACPSCASLVRQVANYYKDGGFVRWGGFRIESIRPYGSGATGKSFAVKGIAGATVYKTSSSATTSRLAGGETTELVTIKRSGGSWRLVGFAKLAN